MSILQRKANAHSSINKRNDSYYKGAASGIFLETLEEAEVVLEAAGSVAVVLEDFQAEAEDLAVVALEENFNRKE